MCKWLDTETKAMLQQAPPQKYAPPDTGMFTLVLLKRQFRGQFRGQFPGGQF
jgi:hypothetical protein